MALTIANGGATALYRTLTSQRHVSSPVLTSPRRALHVVSAKRFSSRSGKKGSGSTTTKDQEFDRRTAEIESLAADNIDDGYFLPELPGDKPDFWEGEKWDALGFFLEYMWAFGFLFAGSQAVAAVAAVATFNEGATDFKETPTYKDAIQSRELLEEPEGSSPDVFESNPTEVAPSLEQ